MKITKLQLKQIIIEEIQQIIKEMSGLGTFRLKGTEDMSSHEVEKLKDDDEFVIVKIVGSEFKNYMPGAITKIPKEIFDSRFVLNTTEDGIDINTFNMRDSGESPADVLRSLGYMSERLQRYTKTKRKSKK